MELGRRGVQSVLIEGGRNVLDQAFDEGVIDEWLVIVAPRGRVVAHAVVGGDVWIRGHP